MTSRRIKSEPRHVAVLSLAAACAVLLLSGPADAYVGPGAGLTAIGTVLALLAAVGLAIVGFVWYPIRRLRRRRKAAAAGQVESGTGDPQ